LHICRFENEWRTAVNLHPQQQKSWQSPTLLTTEVLGMRYLRWLAGLTDVKSYP